MEPTDPPNSMTFPYFPAGDYSVSESTQAGWVLVCVTPLTNKLGVVER